MRLDDPGWMKEIIVYPYLWPERAPVSEVPEGWTWELGDDDDHLQNPYALCEILFLLIFLYSNY